MARSPLHDIGWQRATVVMTRSPRLYALRQRLAALFKLRR